MGKLSLENIKTLINKGYITDISAVAAFQAGNDEVSTLADHKFITQVESIEDLEKIAGYKPTPAHIDSVEPTSLLFKYTGETKTINVTTSGSEGELSCSGLSKFNASVTGKVITVVAPANETSTEISETLTITIAGGNSIDVTCTQEGKPNIDSVSPTSLSFKYTGESKDITITTSGADATITASDISPLTTVVKGKTVTVTAPKNSTAAITKTLTLSITGGNSIDVTCTQEGVPTISKVDPTSLKFEAAGGSKTVTVTTTGATGAISAQKTTHFTTSVSGKTVSITAAKNEGEAISNENVVISIAGGNSVNVGCTQDAGASRIKK